MDDIVRIIGSSPYGVSRVLQSRLAHYAAILYEKSKPISDSEANLTGQALMHGIERTWETLGGGGLLSHIVPAIGPSANVARLHNGTTNLKALVGGALVELRGTTDSAVLDVTLTAPPGSGTRTDLIYVEVWAEEVEPTLAPEAASALVYKRGNTQNATPLTNDLEVVSSTETARRVQIRYAIRSAANLASLAGLAAGDYTYSAGPVVGQYRAGDGSQSAAVTLGSVDGYRHAIPLATVARSVGVTSIAANVVTEAARLVLLGLDSDRVDLIHASSTPVVNKLLALDSGGKYPSSAFSGLAGSAVDVDTVDTFHASATPTASTLLPLDGSVKYPNSVLQTGSGNGLDADTVDAIHAASTPAASKLLALDSGAQYPNSTLHTGTGNALDADMIDSFHAAASPAASKLLSLDSGSKFPNSVLKTGAGQGIDADSVDGYHAVASPAASKLLSLDSGGKFPNSALKTGSDNGIDADLLDGLQAAALALTSHASGYTINAQRLYNSAAIYTLPLVAAGAYTLEDYNFLSGKNVSFLAWFIVRGTMTSPGAPGAFNPVTATIQLSEMLASGSGYAVQFAGIMQDSFVPNSNAAFLLSACLSGFFSLTNSANHFALTGYINAVCTISYSSLQLFSWYR